MAIKVHLDELLARRGMHGKDLAELVGITPVNLSRLRSGKAKAIRFHTLEAICKHLRCKPGDILDYVPDPMNSDSEVQ